MTKEIVIGNVFLIACCVLYLAWWGIAFNPNGKSGVVSTGCIMAAVVTGIIGLVILVKAINLFPHNTVVIPTKYIALGGIFLYFILLMVTSYLLKRQVTTELLLILGWAVLELAVINSLYGAEIYGAKAAIILCIVVAVAAVLSLVCYLLYYQLDTVAGYYDGMVPLITEAVVMGVIVLTVL